MFLKPNAFTLISLLRQSRRSYKGFTLIELMVVIVIIAVLATIGAVMYSSTQKAVRISKRIQDLKAIQTALVTYYAANNSYPVVTVNTDTGWRSECSAWNAGGSITSQTVIPGNFIPQYMAALPYDPSMDISTTRSCYAYRSNGKDYKIMDTQVAEFSQSDYLSKPDFVDALRDGGPVPDGSTANLPNVTPTSCNGTGDGSNVWSWSGYSGGARCW